MSIFELTGQGAVKLEPAGLSAYGATERAGLQRLLRSQIDIVAPDVLVVGEDVGDGSTRAIDLLGVDKRGSLVIVDLERTDDRGQMECHAIRQAALMPAMTFDEVTDLFKRHLKALGAGGSARDLLLAFLGWDAPDEKRFARDVRIVLAAAEFPRDLTESALWLNARGLDIRCVRLRPYSAGARQLLDVEQIVPPPEPAEEPAVAREEKAEPPRAAPPAQPAPVAQPAPAAQPVPVAKNDDDKPEPSPPARHDGQWAGLWFVNVGMDDPEESAVDTSGRGNVRHWDNCVRYGYLAAGGGAWYSDALRKLEPGAHLVAYQRGEGYLGYGVVTQPAEPIERVRVEGGRSLAVTLKQPDYNQTRPDDKWEYAVGVAWRKTFPLNNAKWFKGGFANQNVVCKLTDPETLTFLREEFGIPVQEEA